MVIIEDFNDFVKRLKLKLNKYREFDMYKRQKYPEINEGLETINLQDCINMINQLENNKCVGCGCDLLFCNYREWCVYQFSLDRIDNRKIHTQDNLKVVCFNCNCSGYGSKKLTCVKKCHKSKHRYRDFYWEKSDHIKIFN